MHQHENFLFLRLIFVALSRQPGGRLVETLVEAERKPCWTPYSLQASVHIADKTNSTNPNPRNYDQTLLLKFMVWLRDSDYLISCC
jgi:hypothetical protein